MIVPLLLVALILLIAVIAYVALGHDRVERAWDDLPGPVKTVLNVFVAGSVAVVGAAVVNAGGITDVDWPATGTAALNAGALGVVTAILRAINPIDDAYGLGKATVDDSTDVGDH